MPQVKFAPISTEKQIPGTNCTIQIGVLQNQTRSWGVKLTQAGKILTAKPIKKLIDVEIVGIIRDTIGKTVALDTFELGVTMSELLREVYEKIRGKQKEAEPQKPAPQPTPAIISPQPAIQPPVQSAPAPADFQVSSASSTSTPKVDDFWSSYSNVEVPPPSVHPEPVSGQPVQPAVSVQSPQAGGLDDAMSVLGITCPNCGYEVDADVNKCPFCGQKL